INYALAIVFILIGWSARVAKYYFEYDKDDTTSSLRGWWKIYDRYIIYGFIGCICLAFVSDIIWSWVDVWFAADGVPYDERVNIFIGFIVFGILALLDKKVKDKNNE